MLVPASAGAAAAYRRLFRRSGPLDMPPPVAATPESLRQTLKRQLQGEKVIVVANREPYIHDQGSDGAVQVRHPASGLVTALEPVLEACSGTWIAHGSGSADRQSVDGKDHVLCPPGGKAYLLRRVWMSDEEERGFYYGFANEGLWPLCHLAHQRPVFRREDWRHYRTINQRFADAACEEAGGPTPIVLVQDYHFALVPQMIRQQLPNATVLTFWHIPWPNAEQLAICPFKEEILTGMLHSSILGFHTQLHCNNFIDAIDRFLEARIDREQQAIVLGGRTTLIRPYPISIEWPSRFSSSAPSVEKCRSSVLEELGLPGDTLLGVGIDRLDYTKGIEERLLAIEQLLERYPQFRGRFVFVQVAAPSRTAISRYQQLAIDVEKLVVRINDRFGTERYKPIVLRRQHHQPPDVFRYYRAANVCYVSSLHDGMNLVAKEFVAARDDLHGALVLSSFTGASRELTEALIVNPYDLEQASDALATALSMPEQEQSTRLKVMRHRLAEFNVYRWAERMLVDAAHNRLSGHLREKLTHVEHATGA
jgi:trehalose 6-phosphate synthase